MIRQGLKETDEYRENNRTEDELLDRLFKLRFPRSVSVDGASLTAHTQTGDEHA